MIGDKIGDSKVRWAVQQAFGELGQAQLQTRDKVLHLQLTKLRAKLRRVIEDAEEREND